MLHVVTTCDRRIHVNLTHRHFERTSIKMKVICAGLSKTGTTSLASALRVLGYKVHDLPEHIQEHADEWLAIYRGEKTPDFVSMYDGVDGVTDLPAAFWYEEILEAFPEAKVILTVRDNDDVWVQSWVKHLRLTRDGIKFAALFSSKVRNYLEIFNTVDLAVYGSVSPTATSLFKKKYNAHNERVQAVIPAEKLLIYSIKQGWAPLCQFLGVDVPLREFPHENVGGSMARAGIAASRKELCYNTLRLISPMLLIVLSIIVYSFHWGK